MPSFRRRPAAGPSPVVRARVAALFGLGPPTAAEGPAGVAAADPPDVMDPPPARDPVPVLPARAVLLDPGARGAAALVAVAVAAVAVTGLVVWRGRPRPVDVPPPRVEVSAPAAQAALLVVDVAGAVRRPGLVRLPPGSRVADALAAAGGLRRGATTAGLNLARKLVDGEQVLVGAPGSAGSAGGPAPPPAAGPPLVNLNTATAEQLDDLPGIGPVLAERIVRWRTEHGSFTSVDQLREVSGIGARKFESIRELVTV